MVKSGLMALVAAGLTAPLALLAGSIVFYVQARMGRVDPRNGFEPILFMRQVGLPASAAVFVVTFALALWQGRKSARSARNNT